MKKLKNEIVVSFESGLYKLLHPAISDGRTWSKFGEHGEHREWGEHGKDGKHQPDDLRHSIAKDCLLNG